MASIEIRRSGGLETRQLSRTQPVSVGRHGTCDVQVDEDGVGVLHCRISWNRSAYEVTSGHTSGVDVNGQFVRQLLLADGDVIHVGSVEITTRLDPPRESLKKHLVPGALPFATPAPRPAQPPEIEFEAYEPAQLPVERSDEIDLAPISEDEMLMPKRPTASIIEKMIELKEAGQKEPKRETPNPPAVYKAPVIEKAPERPERGSSSGRLAVAKSSPKQEPKPEPEETDSPSIVDEDLPFAEEIHSAEEIPARGSRLSSRLEKSEKSLVTAKPEEVSPLSRRPRRPGERDPLRSPLVLSMGGGIVALLLATAVTWFMISRSATQKEYDAALADFTEGRFHQAVERFEAFLKDHPRHRYSAPARVGLGKAMIEREIGGTGGAWVNGLNALQKFVDDRRDDPDFADLQPDITRYAEQIALGAAKSAETGRKKEFLKTTADASKLMAQFATADSSLDERQRRISAAVGAAESAIARQETIDRKVAAMDASLAAKRPLEALKARRELLDRYPDAAAGSRVKSLQQRTLEIEKELVVREDKDRDALRDDHAASDPPPLIPAPHPRSRTADVSDSRTVFALAKDCCYGIDAVTGNPLWRRVVGFDPPFFPIPVNTATEGCLLFDSPHQELQLVERRTGRLLWRQPVGAAASGAPTVHEGQIWLATADGSLLKIDLETGRVTSTLRFSQRLMGPPVLTAKDTRLVIVGESELCYTLSLRPPQVEEVTFLGHRQGTIAAPLTPLGAFVLLAENDRRGSARLRALNASGEGTWLTEVGSQRIEGQVRDRPAVRGNELFVPSGEERLSGFIASDVKGTPPLSPTLSFQSPKSRAGSMYLSLGSDGQLWLAGQSLRRLQKKSDTIADDGPILAEGLTTQPLQLIGKTLYVGRRQPFSMAVIFTEADREQMKSTWRTVLGAAPLASISVGDAIVTVTEQGDVLRLGERELSSGGFKIDGQNSLKLPEKLSEPLRAWKLDEDRLAVAASGDEPTLWIVNRTGQVEREVKPDSPLESAPVQLAAGLVLPLSKRLRLLPVGGGKVDDYQAPVEKDESPKWKHVLKLDDSQMLAIDSRGRLSRIQYRASPVPNLSEIAHIDLPHPVDAAPVVDADRFYLADAGKTLQRIEAGTLEAAGESELKEPATQSLWRAGTSLYVETAGNRLHAFTADGLKPLWSAKLDAPLAGAPLSLGGSLVVACQNGDVRAISVETGGAVKELNVGQPAVGGPLSLGSLIVVPTVDGSWHRIEAGLMP